LAIEGTPRLTAGPRPGHRVPDAIVTCNGERVHLHALLAHPGVHILLHRDAADLKDAALGDRVIVHRLTSTPGTGLVAVRPDGYVGFRCKVADVRQLQAWLRRIAAS